MSKINVVSMGAALASSLIFSGVSPQIHAQKRMYQCGSVFQDRPCAPAPRADKPEAEPEPPKSGLTAAEKRAAYQRNLRCDNYSRQVKQLKEKQRTMPSEARMLDAQVQSLQRRMRGDSC